MLGDAQHIEEAKKIGLDYMSRLAGGSIPLRAAKVSMRATRSSPTSSHWPCTSWPPSSSSLDISHSRAHIRTNPCV
ncbi:hypothetical protein ACOSP7_018724 [Xanthoceras sorbifolium]